MYFSVSQVIIEEFRHPLLYNVASIHCGLWAFVMHSSLKDSAFQSDLSLECDLAQQIINYSAALLGIIILLCSSVSASLAA